MRLVRRADEHELDEVRELDLECMGGVAWTPEHSTVWVVEDHDGRICAYASARPSAQFAHVVYFDRAGVAPYARGRGLQRRLIQIRMRWARREGNTHAVTYTLPFNAASGNSLIRCGFRLYQPANPWGGESAVYWIRDLRPKAR